MWHDPIIAELHDTRQKISLAHGDDIHTIFLAAQHGELIIPVALKKTQKPLPVQH